MEKHMKYSLQITMQIMIKRQWFLKTNHYPYDTQGSTRLMLMHCVLVPGRQQATKLKANNYPSETPGSARDCTVLMAWRDRASAATAQYQQD